MGGLAQGKPKGIRPIGIAPETNPSGPVRVKDLTSLPQIDPKPRLDYWISLGWLGLIHSEWWYSVIGQAKSKASPSGSDWVWIFLTLVSVFVVLHKSRITLF